VVTFDHRDPGTYDLEWRGDRRWAEVDRLDTSAVSSVLVVAAHPDDETLGAGGLIASLHRRGARVTVLLATRGGASHPGGIQEKRVDEFRSALARIAPAARIVDADLADSRLGDHRDELTMHVMRAADGVDLILAPWRGDGHGDHRAAGEIAASVAMGLGVRLLEYPIWLWHWGAPHSPETPWGDFVRFEIDEHSGVAKARGLECYASQRLPNDNEPPILHERMLAHFQRDWETFIWGAT
jgi:LmbE family N-acetylglucosaminyl deacetylase